MARTMPRSRIFPLSLALSLCLAAVPAWASQPLTWEQAVAEAARNNPDLLASAEDLRQAELAVRVARAAFLPSASASASLGTGGPYRADGVPGSFGEGRPSSSARLSANLDLFSGFGDLAGLAQARLQWASAEAAAQDLRARVGFELRSAFIGLLQAQEREAQAASIARRRGSNVELVQLRFDAGREHKGALLQVQALAAQAQAQARRAARERERAALNLARLLGRDPQPALRAEGALEAVALPGEGPPADLGGLPAVRRARLAQEGARQGLRQVQAAWWPSLGASASAGRSGGDWLGEQGSWSAGLSLSLPLFQGGRRLAQTRSAASRLEAAGLAALGAERQARLDLEAAWASLADAVDGVAVQAAFLEAGEVRAEVAQAQYAQGLLGFEAWDQVENDLINAQVQALAARGDAQRALAAWQRSLGRSPWP